MRRGKGYRLLALCAGLLLCAGCTGQQKEGEPLQMAYYYVPACESCEDGAAYAAALEEQLRDMMTVGEDYVLELKDLTDQEAYEEFQDIAKEYQTDTFYPTPPVLKVGSTYIFGLGDIEQYTRTTAIVQFNAGLTAEQVKERLGEANPEDSVFVYFYKEDCPYCQEIEGYLSALDHTQYLEDGTPSDLKIIYVDAGDVDNMPLVGAMYDQYQVPEEERKSPMIFWQGGYAMGRAAIREVMIPTILTGEAQNWPGWEEVPVK